jgi:hypothetical protein
MLPVVQFSNTAVQHLLAEIVAIPFMLFWTLAVPHRALLGSAETVFFFPRAALAATRSGNPRRRTNRTDCAYLLVRVRDRNICPTSKVA